MGWPLVRLGEVAAQYSEYVTELEPRPYKKLSVKLYGRGVVPDKPADGAEVRMTRHQIAKAGQVIVSEIWAKKGALGVVPSEGDGALCTSHFFLFDLDPSQISVEWFRYLSIANYFEPELGAAARGTTGYASVRPKRFLDVQIPLPPLAEQQRIVARLDRVAGLVAARERATAAMEADMQAMLAKAFARCIEDAPRRPMAEVAPLIRRPVEIEPDTDYTEIGVRSFYNGIFHRRTMPGSEFSWQDLFWIKEGDLVFSNLMAWEKAIAVAEAHDEGTVGNHRMLTCEANPELATPGFLLAYFRTPEGFSSVVGNSPGTIARNKTLSSKKLPAIEVPVPPLETQRRFDRLQAKARRIRTIRAASALDADALIPALLHQVFGAGDRAA
ncbi:restriction endonuclease subunit S [Paracoccus limosus]|uniref:Restriction endonuclease subunit S n=1 Tax=Paracoccus limosus TaxID=913252 RepID=A0A844H5L2_9RHOB|nr:restriction endonuclease subunit S [Paracoccus limosus]MTH36072.1 restriction endonuclease subunit S [Paracoccus limosus]